MADVEFVIKIPEEEFGIDIANKFQDFFNRIEVETKEHMISGNNLVCGAYEIETICMFKDAFANAILLPKGHGRLIDADELKKHKYHDNDRYENAVSIAQVDWQPTIIEADKEGEK